MKKITFLPLLMLSIFACAERIEPLPFGDMEQWTVRYITESKLLGGQTKTLYCLAPTDTIRENAPYIYGPRIAVLAIDIRSVLADSIRGRKAILGPLAMPMLMLLVSKKRLAL